MKVGKWILALVFVGGIGWEALAHEPRRPAAPRPPGSETEEELRETMSLLMVIRMKRELDLTKDQEEVILPLMEELQHLRREARRETHGAMRHLRGLLDDPSSRDGVISDQLEEIQALRRDVEDRQREIRAEIETPLDVRQRAKMIFFMERFRNQMEKRIRNIEVHRREMEFRRSLNETHRQEGERRRREGER